LTFKTSKKIDKIDATLSLQLESIEIYKEIFSHTPMSIANIETLEGLEVEKAISCVGFDENGTPILSDRDDQKVKYHIFGSKIGSGFVTPVYNVGMTITKLVNGERTAIKIKGYEGLGRMLGVSAEKCQTEIQKCLDSGNERIYVRWLHNLLGLEEDYGLFKDEVIFSGQAWDRKEIDYNAVWNKILLPKLKSKWRILTPEMRSLLENKKTNRLREEFE
jgi:hypothetical protein